MTTTARYDGSTDEYQIYTTDGVTPLLGGKCSMDEFHRLTNAIRKAEKLAAVRAVDQYVAAVGDFMEVQRAKQQHG